MKKLKINNDYYNHLGDKWYDSDRNPIAVLRAEQNIKNPWVHDLIKKNLSHDNLSILDVGCGGGFLTNYLSRYYPDVAGVDASMSSLEIAKKRDLSSKVQYTLGDAYNLPYEDNSKDVVCAMDFLEHVENPQKVIKECSRVLKPGGIFFYHTFNRNFLSWLIVIKFMEWFVPNTPKNLHVYHLFIRPSELFEMMEKSSLKNIMTQGLGPKFNTSFINSILKRKVMPGFEFQINQNTTLGYIGMAKKLTPISFKA